MAAILSGWIDATDWMPRIHSLAEDRKFAARIVPHSVVWDDGRLCGFLTLNRQEIDCLYVAEHARGQGVGHRLLAYAKGQSPRLELWTFAANTGARRFYMREGFVEVTQTDGAENAERLPDVRLAWDKGEEA